MSAENVGEHYLLTHYCRLGGLQSTGHLSIVSLRCSLRTPAWKSSPLTEQRETRPSCFGDFLRRYPCDPAPLSPASHSCASACHQASPRTPQHPRPKPTRSPSDRLMLTNARPTLWKSERGSPAKFWAQTNATGPSASASSICKQPACSAMANSN